MKNVRVAIVGCGKISEKHISAILSNDRFKLIAICDNSELKINKTLDLVKEKYNFLKSNLDLPTSYMNYQELINDHKNKFITIDLMIISTPSGYHSIQTIIAAKNGINVCTEKPMAINLKDAKNMVEICEENNVKLFVVKQNRLNKTIQDLKNKVDLNMFGTIGIVSINVFWNRSQEYYDQDEWRGTLELDGGALMNQAIHYVDLLEWILGPIKNISAFLATRVRDIEAEDTAVMSIEWINGALGTLAVTMITHPKNLEGSITIIGDKGSAKVGGIALNKFEYAYFKEDLVQAKSDYIISDSEKIYGYGHQLYYENILNVFDEKSEPICSGEDALSSINLINNAYKAFKEKKIININ